MISATRESLASIKIVYCAPDTLALYGIPYEMRRDVGQAPRHLWECARNKPRTMRQGLDVLADWIPLDERDPLVKAWLASVRERDGLPGWPHEWVRLSAPRRWKRRNSAPWQARARPVQ